MGSLSSPKVEVLVDMGNPLLNHTLDGLLKIGTVCFSCESSCRGDLPHGQTRFSLFFPIFLQTKWVHMNPQYRSGSKRRHMYAIKVQRTRQHCHGSNPKLVSEANVGKWGQ
ncbi:hypothetical protein Hanom_Chr06g00516171 [Helianthus anomalus]